MGLALLRFRGHRFDSPDDPVEVAVGMEEVCLLPHTSGTTGPPKGVMLTHANLTWNVLNFLDCADFRMMTACHPTPPPPRPAC